MRARHEPRPVQRRRETRPSEMLVATCLALVVSCECGGSSTSDYALVPEPDVEVAAPPEASGPERALEAEERPSPGSDPEHERGLLAELLATVGDEDDDHGFDPNAPSPRTLADAIGDCSEDGSDDGDFSWFICRVQPVAALDSRGRFVVLSPESELSGHTDVAILQIDVDARRPLLSIEAFGAPLAAIRRRLRGYGRLAVLPDLVAARTYVDFGIGIYSPLVALSEPLDGWVLWHETTDLSVREDRLHLMRADGAGDRVLATRPSIVGPCGDRWCEINNADPNAECTDAMLEAEGKLCVIPTGVAYVTIAPSGLLLVTEEVIASGHDDANSPTQWSAMLPEDLRP